MQLIYPYFVSKNDALKFLESQRVWIEKHASIISIANNKKNQPLTIPDSIHLLAVEKEYEVVYRYLPNSYSVKLQIIGNELMVCGETNSYDAYQTQFVNWLKLQAHQYLTPKLIEISKNTKLPFQSINYRSQKTLWGSCSHDGNISLNIKLLFLPSKLVHYVMLHELCHTQHLNHSRHFWKLMRTHIPDCQELHKSLKFAEKYLPYWV